MKRLFIDMDGTLAKFDHVEKIEDLYNEGYFLKRPPLQNVVDAVKLFKKNNPAVEVYILSAVLTDSKYALAEKNEWLNDLLPEIGEDKRIFCSCGKNKADYVPGGIKETDYLLDDYSVNLHEWVNNGKGIKVLNGINGNLGTWTGATINYLDGPEYICDGIEEAMEVNRMREIPSELREILEKHQKWIIKSHGGEKADLSYKDLSGMDLRYFDIAYADFHHANLRGANLEQTNLCYTNFEGADLSNVNLTCAQLDKANLNSANLRNAKLRYTNLIQTTLKNADLSSADICGANFYKANLEGTNFTDATLISSNLNYANLTRAVLTGIRGDELFISRLIQERDLYYSENEEKFSIAPEKSNPMIEYEEELER